MSVIDHELKIDAAPERVFEALTTLEGVRGWHAPTASGTGEVDARLRSSSPSVGPTNSLRTCSTFSPRPSMVSASAASASSSMAVVRTMTVPSPVSWITASSNP